MTTHLVRLSGWPCDHGTWNGRRTGSNSLRIDRPQPRHPLCWCRAHAQVTLSRRARLRKASRAREPM